MARRRLIIHGSQEELDMFEPIYNTRLRLQHGTVASRFQLPDPPRSVGESEQEGEDEDRAVANILDSGNGVDRVETDSCNNRLQDDEEDDDDVIHSQEEPLGSDNNGVQGNGSETQACPESDTNTDSDSDS